MKSFIDGCYVVFILFSVVICVVIMLCSSSLTDKEFLRLSLKELLTFGIDERYNKVSSERKNAKD